MTPDELRQALSPMAEEEIRSFVKASEISFPTMCDANREEWIEDIVQTFRDNPEFDEIFCRILKSPTQAERLHFVELHGNTAEREATKYAKEANVHAHGANVIAATANRISRQANGWAIASFVVSILALIVAIVAAAK